MSSTCASTAQDRQKQAEGEKAGAKYKKLKIILRRNTALRNMRIFIKNLQNFTIFSVIHKENKYSRISSHLSEKFVESS
jgi:hypothetical protein